MNAALKDVRLSDDWGAIIADPDKMRPVAMQSYDASLSRLRKTALSKIPVGASGPRFIWMGRDEGGAARARGLSGAGPLLEELASRGFDMIEFEHLTPLEQITAMHSADVVIAPHGAGLANMVYAKPGALVIEIGTRQTQLHRWGDFLKCAHVSGCRYDTVFADIDGLSGEDDAPPMSEGHRGIHIGRRATERILSLLDEEMGR